jgi:mRNA interferase MazF
VIHRGGIYWADPGEASASKPAKRRPVLVIQSGPFNASRLSTTVAAVITSDTRLATMPGNVFIPAAATGLPRDSVVNVTALVTLDKTDLGTQAGHLPDSLMDDVDRGLRGCFPCSKAGARIAPKRAIRPRSTRSCTPGLGSAARIRSARVRYSSPVLPGRVV